MADGWTEIDERLDDGTEIGRVKTVSLGRGCAWVVAESGGLFVRAGVSREHPSGMRWDRVPQEYSVTNALACGSNIWGLVEPNNVVLRKGFSNLFPYGTHWELSNGLVLSPFHLEGSPSIDDAPTDNAATPPSRPPCDVTALDVTGTSKRRYVVDKSGRVLRGDEARHGVVEWTEEWSGALQVTEGDGGLMWALTADGGVKIKSSGASQWNSLQSVSAYEPTRPLKWSRLDPSDDATSVPATSSFRRGDGQVINQGRSLWGEVYEQLLHSRNAAITDFIADSEKALWQPFIREPILGSKTIAHNPADDYWQVWSTLTA